MFKCELCGKKKVGELDVWYQGFTQNKHSKIQRPICSECIKNE